VPGVSRISENEALWWIETTAFGLTAPTMAARDAMAMR
jgi:hypothetical protein